MEAKELIHLVSIIIYMTLVLFVILFILVYTRSKTKVAYIFSTRYKFIILNTIISVTIAPLELYKNGFQDNYNLKLIEYNLYYVIGCVSLLSYSYRGFYIYINDNLNFRKKHINSILKKIYLSAYFLILVYVVIMNILIFYKKMPLSEYFLYVYYGLSFVYVLLHPCIIYLLNSINNNIKYDYIFTLFIFTFTLIIKMLNDFEITILQIVEKYYITITSSMSIFFYLIIPFSVTFYKSRNNLNRKTYLNKITSYKISAPSNLLNVEIDVLNKYGEYNDLNTYYEEHI